MANYSVVDARINARAAAKADSNYPAQAAGDAARGFWDDAIVSRIVTDARDARRAAIMSE